MHLLKGFSVSNAFAYNYLSQYKGLDFIYDFYDVEHTFSIDDVVEDMQKVCQRNGGPLPERAIRLLKRI